MSEHREPRLPALPPGYEFEAEVRHGRVEIRLRRRTENLNYICGEAQATTRWGVEREAKKLAKVAWLARAVGDDE